MFKLQHRDHNGRWKDARFGKLRYTTEAEAKEAINALDQDGCGDFTNNRVVPVGK